MAKKCTHYYCRCVRAYELTKQDNDVEASKVFHKEVPCIMPEYEENEKDPDT